MQERLDLRAYCPVSPSDGTARPGQMSDCFFDLPAASTNACARAARSRAKTDEWAMAGIASSVQTIEGWILRKPAESCQLPFSAKDLVLHASTPGAPLCEDAGLLYAWAKPSGPVDWRRKLRSRSVWRYCTQASSGGMRATNLPLMPAGQVRKGTWPLSDCWYLRV